MSNIDIAAQNTEKGRQRKVEKGLRRFEGRQKWIDEVVKEKEKSRWRDVQMDGQ